MKTTRGSGFLPDFGFLTNPMPCEKIYERFNGQLSEAVRNLSTFIKDTNYGEEAKVLKADVEYLIAQSRMTFTEDTGKYCLTLYENAINEKLNDCKSFLQMAASTMGGKSKKTSPKIHVGPRGGRYYVKKGKKVYV